MTAVSQTCGPEAVLSGELELPYALGGFPVNYATGVSQSRKSTLDRFAEAFAVAGFRREAFYPGYGDSWPMFQGAVAMTYEQASPRGLAFRRDDGTILTYKMAVTQHFTAAVTTAVTAAKNRERLVREFLEYRRSAIALGQGNHGPGPLTFQILPLPRPAISAMNALVKGWSVGVMNSSEPMVPSPNWTGITRT